MSDNMISEQSSSTFSLKTLIMCFFWKEMFDRRKSLKTESAGEAFLVKPVPHEWVSMTPGLSSEPGGAGL